MFLMPCDRENVCRKGFLVCELGSQGSLVSRGSFVSVMAVAKAGEKGEGGKAGQ